MKTSIPVHVLNPGQVFACMGFLEAADALMGGAKGWFAEGRFYLEVPGEGNPFAKVLEFLAHADVQDDMTGTWPGPDAQEDTIRHVQLVHNNKAISVGHWADGSSRNSFKLYAGSQTGKGAAQKMLEGVKELFKGHDITNQPFDTLVGVKGSFHFDVREAWDALSAGYSPNDQGHEVASSPVVELLAAIGLEHARPDEYEKWNARYGVWGTPLPPFLARAALGGSKITGAMRYFHFEIFIPGQGIKNLTFAQEEVVS